MARLHEYMGKRLLKEAGLVIPEGQVASTPEEAREIARMIGKSVAVKAQVWTTGRLKAGAIKFAATPDEAFNVSHDLLGSKVKGFPVDQVLVEEKLEIAQEYYAGIIVDPSYKVRAPVVMFSTQGGVDVESVSPEHLARAVVDIFEGLEIDEARKLVQSLAVPERQVEPLSRAVAALYEAFRRYDARSAEINPLVLTRDGRVLAADCRVSIDDASVSRHPELKITVPRESDSPPTELDKAAWKIEEDDYRGVAFFAQMVPDTRAGGYIGYHAIGGGGALLAADMLVRHGLKLANYAETSGNPTAAKVYRIAKLILSQPGLVGYCLMGAVIASQDQWHHAHGLVKAFREMLSDRPGFPVVILIAGNKEEEAREILREGLADLPIHLELYGREYIHQLSHIAERTKALVDEYQARQVGTASSRLESPTFNSGTRLDFRTGHMLIDDAICEYCTSLACVKACSLYGGYLFRVRGGKRTLGVPSDTLARLCPECLACEYECQRRGQGALRIELPIGNR